MPCTVSVKQAQELSALHLKTEAEYICYRCKPDETTEMEKQMILCVADCRNQQVAIMSQTAC